MKNTITLQNLENNKIAILNSVSIYGSIISPNKWNENLCIFEFENLSVAEKVTSFLTDEFSKQLSTFKKTYLN
jgi:hypothetical protein